MNKSIIVSEKPQSVCDILNGIKKCLMKTESIPIETKVYVYCTKNYYSLIDRKNNRMFKNMPRYVVCERSAKSSILARNGKVVGSFVVSKCKEVLISYMGWGYIILNNKLKEIDRQIIPIPKGEKRKICKLSKDSCVDMGKLHDYGKWTSFVKGQRYKKLYAWYISQLEIFDKPKELSDFMTIKNYKKYQQDLEDAENKDEIVMARIDKCFEFGIPTDEVANNTELVEMTKELYCLKKAPQKYVYVEEVLI